jgi:hypothetical protein
MSPVDFFVSYARCCNGDFRTVRTGEMAPNHIAILIPVIVGLAATVATIAIHGVVVHAIIMSLRRDLKRGLVGVRTWMNMTFIMAAILLALGGHLAEITFWAFVLDMSGAVADIGAAIYSSAGSYTTSGSDVTLPPNADVRRLDRVHLRGRQSPDSCAVRGRGHVPTLKT